MFCKTEDPFYFTSSLPLPLYILPFDFSSSLPLSGSIKEPAIQTPTRQLFWDIVCHLLCQPAFQIKVVFLVSAPQLSDSLVCCSVSRVLGLSNKITWAQKPLYQFSSVAQSCLTFCDPMEYSTPKFPVLHQIPELTQTHLHRVGDAIQPSCPLSSPSPPAFNLFQNQHLFQWVSSSHQGAKVWSFSFSINPSNEYSGLISFRMDWLDLLAVQGTLKSLL